MVIGMVVVMASCGGGEASRGPACGETQQEHLECLREVGFVSIDGLEVHGVDKEQGLDRWCSSNSRDRVMPSTVH